VVSQQACPHEAVKGIPSRSQRPSRSKELGAEVVNDVPDRLQEVLKRWDDRFAFSRPDLLERYLRGGIDLHIHLAVLHGTADQWCLNIAAANNGGRDLELRCRELWPEVDSGDSRRTDDSDHEPMLVDVVQAGEDCEGMVLDGQAICSVAGLMVTDGFSCVGRNARYFGPVVGLVANGLGRIGNSLRSKMLSSSGLLAWIFIKSLATV